MLLTSRARACADLDYSRSKSQECSGLLESGLSVAMQKRVVRLTKGRVVGERVVGETQNCLLLDEIPSREPSAVHGCFAHNEPPPPQDHYRLLGIRLL